jgi:DNA-directed RNA polymerase specialized sigma24 family protein
MHKCQFETSYFRYVRRLDGTLEPVDLARRNGRLAPRFHPSVTEPEMQSTGEESPEYRELVEEVSRSLNEIERRTWLKILDGRSILDIADEEGVSRAAIYDRISRMVSKNAYCQIWWRHKNKTNQHT